jgi:uncharacterized protein YprB with RNaseH-like and TPR domain
MKRKNIKKFLEENRGYIKWGKAKLAEKFKSTYKEIDSIIREIHFETKEIDERNNDFKRMFFDIETSYNIVKAWRTGYNLNINPGDIIHERAVICVSWKWEGENKVYNLKWDDNQCDKQLLIDFNKQLEMADEVVAHNGDRFDIKWLRTRCLMQGIPFRTYIKSLDTLRKVKSMFNFQSNKLDYIASVLGFGHKLPTGMKLWDDIILHKSKEAMTKMVEYCDHDVVLLEDVYNKLKDYIKPNTHVGVHKGKGKHSCPQCGTEDVKYIKNTVTAAGTIKRHMECKECSTDYVIPNTAFKKFIKGR